MQQQGLKLKGSLHGRDLVISAVNVQYASEDLAAFVSDAATRTQAQCNYLPGIVLVIMHVESKVCQLGPCSSSIRCSSRGSSSV